MSGFGENRMIKEGLRNVMDSKDLTEPRGKATAFDPSPPLPSPRLVFPSHSDMYHKTPVELEDRNYEENMKMSFVH